MHDAGGFSIALYSARATKVELVIDSTILLIRDALLSEKNLYYVADGNFCVFFAYSRICR